MIDVPDLNDFYHDGKDWICRQCERQTERDRTWHETKERKPPVARWTDRTRRFLTCPHCGITEPVERS